MSSRTMKSVKSAEAGHSSRSVAFEWFRSLAMTLRSVIPIRRGYRSVGAPIHWSQEFLALHVQSCPSGERDERRSRSAQSLTGNTGGAVPYRAPRTSARHTGNAGGRSRSSDPGFRRVQRHRDDGLLRDMQRERDRTKHGAADECRPDDSQFFHEIFPSVRYGSQFSLIGNNASNIEHRAEFNLASLDLCQRPAELTPHPPVSGEFLGRLLSCFAIFSLLLQ